MTGIKSNNKNCQQGFSIIETIVVLAVFLLIVGVGLGIFISIIANQKKVLLEQKVINQISFVEEHMSKALRMAKRADGTEDCIPKDAVFELVYAGNDGFFQGIRFIDQTNNNACTEFFLDTGRIFRETINQGAWKQLISADIKINYIRFGLNGGNGCSDSTECPSSVGKTDTRQPMVTILMSVEVDGPGQDHTRVIQTTVSARNLNVQ